jgi:hypothetical protein
MTAARKSRGFFSFNRLDRSEFVGQSLGMYNLARRDSTELPEGAVENSPGQAKRSPGNKPQLRTTSPVGASELSRTILAEPMRPSA